MKKLFCCFNCFKCKNSKTKKLKSNPPNDSSHTFNPEDIQKKQDDLPALKINLVDSNPDNNIQKEESQEEDLKNSSQNKNINIKINNDKGNFSLHGINLNTEISDDDLILSEDSPLICEYEKSITFNKKGLAAQFDKIWNLEGYRKVWDKENLICEIRNEGTPFNNQFSIAKFGIRHHKSELGENGDVPTLIQFFYNPKIRTIWDTNIKSLERYEGNDNFFVVNTWAKPPVFFMSERDAVEKKLIFDYQNASYVFSSSVSNDLFPENPDVVRIWNYVDYFKVADEGDYIGYYSLSQSDFKMIIPQMLANMALPSSTKGWFAILKNFAAKAKYDKITKTVKKDEDDDDSDDE